MKNLIQKSTFIVSLIVVTAFIFSFRLDNEQCAMEAFQPRSNGAAAMGLGDKTGSPLSGGATCAGCHGAPNSSTSFSITLKDATGNAVTSYTPGNNYTVEYVVSDNSLNGFGFQGVALTNNNWQAGILTSTLTPNTQITNLVSTGGGLQYAEHLGTSPTGIFSLNWTAPFAGAGDVTFYGTGLAVNSNGGTSGDNTSSPISVIISESSATSIAYSQGIYCQNDADPTPTISGTSGGTFSSTTGLSIDPNTGTVDLSASTAGPYMITYTYNGGSAVYTISIAELDNAAFSYQNATFCANSGIITPIVTGLIGGSFTSNSPALALDPSTGVIDLFNSAGGNYDITYTSSGPCPNSATFNITIIEIDNTTSTTGNVLSANLSGASYLWVDCDNNFAPIAGETGQNFTASANGNYAVEITANGCTTISDCINITFNGILENSFGENLTVFPNPTLGNLSIDFGKQAYRSLKIELFSIDGKLLGNYSFNNTSQIELFIEQPAGYYLINIEASEGQKATIKLLKQ